MYLPTIVELERNIDHFANNNLEEILLSHPAIDFKFLNEISHKINFERLSNIFCEHKKSGKLKTSGYELEDMCKRAFNISLEK